ncbi:MAG: MarC family protein [Alphaproteobacteria bacterium]|nr:MarC family protein [Alphaproteobacteria bacterium]
MFDLALVAFTTLFATIGPIDAAVVFAAITANASARDRRHMAIRGALIATGILLVFALGGDFVLERLGVTLSGLRVGGGILLMLMAIDMVFGRVSTASSTTADEAAEATTRTDVSVFPLATPLLAGPGALGAIVLLMGNVEDDYAKQAVVIGVMIGIMVLALVVLLGATQIHRFLSRTALNVITRVFGVLLAALAAQFILDGIKNSGAFS